MGGRLLGAVGRGAVVTEEIAQALPRGEYPIKEISPGPPDLPHAVSDHAHTAGAVRCQSAGGSHLEMDEQSQSAHMAAIIDQQGRIKVLMTHNTDIADSWECQADDPEFFFNSRQTATR